MCPFPELDDVPPPQVNVVLYGPSAPPHLLANALEFKTTIFHCPMDTMCQVDVDPLEDLR